MKCELWNGTLVEWYWQGKNNLSHEFPATTCLSRGTVWLLPKSGVIKAYSVKLGQNYPFDISIFGLHQIYLEFRLFLRIRKSRFAFCAWRPVLPSNIVPYTSSYPSQSPPMFHSRTLQLVYHILYIIILTALLMALDLNICLRLKNHLPPAVVFDLISSPTNFF